MISRKPHAAACALLLLAVTVAGGCGRKTDPATPDSPRPAAVADIKIAVRDRIAYLSWPVPTKNAEGKPIGSADVSAFSVYRAELGQDHRRPRYREIAEIDMADPAPAVVRDGSVFWNDTTIQYDRVYGYRIRAYGARGGVSSYSAEVRAAPILSLAAPKNVAAAAGDGSVTLTWDAVTVRTDGTVHQGFVGYNVFRSTERDRHADTALNKEPVRENAYTDRTVVNGTAYYYRVRSVDSPVLPGKESPDSDEVEARPMDRTPPASPSGVTVVPGIGRVFLTWNENNESDLAGYHVYRGTKSGEAARLTERPINRSTYSDDAVQQGMTYYYAVTAVDTTGNESARSKEYRTYTEKVR